MSGKFSIYIKSTTMNIKVTICIFLLETVYNNSNYNIIKSNTLLVFLALIKTYK